MFKCWTLIFLKTNSEVFHILAGTQYLHGGYNSYYDILEVQIWSYMKIYKDWMLRSWLEVVIRGAKTTMFITTMNHIFLNMHRKHQYQEDYSSKQQRDKWPCNLLSLIFVCFSDLSASSFLNSLHFKTKNPFKIHTEERKISFIPKWFDGIFPEYGKVHKSLLRQRKHIRTSYKCLNS